MNVPVLTSSKPATDNVLPLALTLPPPDLSIVRFLKVLVPLKFFAPLPVNETVPLLCVKVPLLLQLPATPNALGAVIDPAVIVKSLPTSALFEKVHPPPLPLKVRLLNLLDPVRVPASVFHDEVDVNVTVPLLFENVPLLL